MTGISMSEAPPPESMALKIKAVSQMTGLTVKTIRRYIEEEADFPKPFRYRPGGNLMWVPAEVRAYIEKKASVRLGG